MPTIYDKFLGRFEEDIDGVSHMIEKWDLGTTESYNARRSQVESGKLSSARSSPQMAETNEVRPVSIFSKLLKAIRDSK